jgi:two-component system chemotaxis response regulator CheB
LGNGRRFYLPRVCDEELVKLREGKKEKFHCHTGHACSSSALLSAVMEKTGESYWDAMRGLEEAAMLLERTGKSLMQVRRTRGRYF